MSIIKTEVQFEGSVWVEVDTDDYPHYFENNGARGGVKQLVEDLFYDDADLWGKNFQPNTAEFYNAEFEVPDF